MGIPIGSLEVWFGFMTTGDSETMYTHLAYDIDGTVDQTALDAGFADFQTEFKELFSSETQLTGGHILEGAAGGTIRWESSVASVAGTTVGNAPANNLAILVQKFTGLGGRRHRGRMFFPPGIETQVSPAGILNSAALTAWGTALPELLPGGGVHTAFGFLGDAQLLHETGSQTPTTITSLAVSTKCATQRRRMRR